MWQVDGGMNSGKYLPGPALDLPEDVGQTRFANHALGHGSAICVGEVNFLQHVDIFGRFDWDVPFVQLNVTLSGLAMSSAGGSPTLWDDPTSFSLFMPEEPTTETYNTPNRPHRFASLILTPKCLQDFFEGQTVPPLIRRFMQGARESMAYSGRSSTRMRQIVSDLFGNPYTGAVGGLYAKGRACELIAELVIAMADSDSHSMSRLGASDRRRAEEAREIIMADITVMPSAKELAQQVGLSQKRLNELFREIHGGSVFQCLMRWRLDLARRYLIKDDLPIKQIAHILGYKHTNNFILAFSRRFGMPPAAYRRQRFPDLKYPNGG